MGYPYTASQGTKQNKQPFPPSSGFLSCDFSQQWDKELKHTKQNDISRGNSTRCAWGMHAVSNGDERENLKHLSKWRHPAFMSEMAIIFKICVGFLFSELLMFWVLESQWLGRTCPSWQTLEGAAYPKRPTHMQCCAASEPMPQSPPYLPISLFEARSFWLKHPRLGTRQLEINISDYLVCIFLEVSQGSCSIPSHCCFPSPSGRCIECWVYSRHSATDLLALLYGDHNKAYSSKLRRELFLSKTVGKVKY